LCYNIEIKEEVDGSICQVPQILRSQQLSFSASTQTLFGHLGEVPGMTWKRGSAKI